MIKGERWLLESPSHTFDIITMLGSSSVVSLIALASTAFAAPSGVEKRAPTVYLAGDSTMATARGGAGTLQGKLSFIQKYNRRL